MKGIETWKKETMMKKVKFFNLVVPEESMSTIGVNNLLVRNLGFYMTFRKLKGSWNRNPNPVVSAHCSTSIKQRIP